MWNKKDKSEDRPRPSDEELAHASGDAGGPVSQVDPEEIVAHEDARAALEARIASLEAEAAEAREKYTRALADFQNYQRRALENEKEARRQGITAVVGSMLGVLDNFDLALKQDATKSSAESILQGVSMIRSMLAQSLASVGVQSIEPRPGDEFDPHRHEAVAQVPAEGIEPGRIAACYQTGYSLGDRVLRPAKASVSRAAEQ
ncbi:MAG: nucleotide exchange factor GrpE [Planctomycetota bacterium]|nr:nucleotide exchange factor GrpE [Planctomycetota bacterium]